MSAQEREQPPDNPLRVKMPFNAGLGVPIDYLPLVLQDDRRVSERYQALRTLARCKVQTTAEAEGVTYGCIRKTEGTIDALEAISVGALLQLGRDVAGFGEKGDLVWVVHVRRGLTGGVTQELWICSTTGAVLALFPPPVKAE